MSSYSWWIADCQGDDAESSSHLFVLPEDVVTYWTSRRRVLGCSTWGEVRLLGDDVYSEVLGLAGYGTYEEFVAHFEIVGEAPGLEPGPTAEAEQLLQSESGPPTDDMAFNAEDLDAYNDGDWPPSIHYLVAQNTPPTVITDYGDRWVTVFNGVYASIRAANKDTVLEGLREQGHTVAEDDRISDLLGEWA